MSPLSYAPRSPRSSDNLKIVLVDMILKSAKTSLNFTCLFLVYFISFPTWALSYQAIDVGWSTDGKLIQGHCFYGIDSRNDMLEGYAEAVGIPSENFEEFIVNPGKYMGNPISSLEPVELKGWLKGEYFSPAFEVSQCIDSSNIFNSGTEGVTAHQYSNKYGSWETYYILRSEVSLSICQSLVDKNFKAKCAQSYLVSVLHRMGSGSRWSHGIYGLFSQNGTNYIVPLKHWQAWVTGDGDEEKELHKAFEFIKTF